MVKGKKKIFLQFNDANAALLASQKKEGGADKPAAVLKKPPRRPQQQYSLETSESCAENISNLSLHDPVNFRDPIHSNLPDLTFSPPLAPEPVGTNTPSYGNIVKGDAKTCQKKERPHKPEAQTSLENTNKHMPSISATNEHTKSVTQDSTICSELPPNPPVTQEPSQATNWVRSAPPMSTPKPFGANLDRDTLIVNVPSEPLTISVTPQSESTTEVNAHTPLSATLNVDAPVFQPKSVQNIPEFVPHQVEIPVSAPETAEYAYDENTAHQAAYVGSVYSEVALSNTMVPAEFYPQLTNVVPPMMPYLSTPDMPYPTYPMPVPINNSGEVHHMSSDISQNYTTDLPNATQPWQQPSIYHEDDPNRDPMRGHRGVYSTVPNRGFNQYGRRNSAQANRYPDGRSYPPTSSRRDSQNSEVSDTSYNHGGRPPRNQYSGPNDRGHNRSKYDTRTDYQQSYRSSNNNHNKNRDQNQIRPNNTAEYGHEKPVEKSQEPPPDNWDEPNVAADLPQRDEQLTCPVPNYQEAHHQNKRLSGNNFDQHHNQEAGFDPMFNHVNSASSGRTNPKDTRWNDKNKSKREDGRGRQVTLDAWVEWGDDGSSKNEEFKSWFKNWEDYETLTNVEEITADLFAMGKEYSLAHCVAEDMRMGSGIAVTFKRDFKRQDVLLQQRARPGGLAVLEDEDRFIYYLVTKKQSTSKPNYYTLWSSLMKMKEHIEKNNVEKLAIPRIGCGLDRLEWTKVKSMIQHLFKESNIHITVCNFQQNEEQPQTSPPAPKQFNSCRAVTASYPICDIEPGTIIVFLSTETCHVSKEMEELDKKFNFVKKFQEARKRQGEIFIHEDFQKNYVLCGCIVRNSPKDRLDFVSLAKCVSALNKYNRTERLSYVGFQTVAEEDFHEEDLNSRIITILINYLKKVDVYICGDNSARKEE